MAYTVRQLLQSAYPILGKHWSTFAMWSNSFLELTNSILEQIYNYGWYIRSWQHYREAFTNLQWVPAVPAPNNNPLQLVTSYPIWKIDKFWTGKMLPVVGQLTFCDCPVPEPDPCGPYIPACTNCFCETCSPEDWKEVLPNNQLCHWQYQVGWSTIKGMGWLNGTVIRVKPNKQVTALWVTYFRYFNEVKSFDDIVLLPRWFRMAFIYAIASLVVWSWYGQFRQWQDVNYYQQFITEMDRLKAADNIFPKDLIFDPTYPFFGDQNSNFGSVIVT